MKSWAQSTVGHSYRYVDDEHTLPVPGTRYLVVAYSQLSATLHKPGTWATGTYKVPALVVPVVPDTWQQYTLLDIRSESIIYVGLQLYKIERTFYTFLWRKSSTFFRKAGAEK